MGSVTKLLLIFIMNNLFGSSLAIKARIAIKNYCSSTTADDRSWEDFNTKNPGFSQDEYNEGILIFGSSSTKSSTTPIGQRPTIESPTKPNTIEKNRVVPPKKQINTPEKDVSEKPYVSTRDNTNDKRIIDGFAISTEIFNITKPYVEKRYNEFNKKYFDGELPEVPVTLSKTKNAAGTYRYTYSFDLDKVISHTLCVSVFMQRSEEAFCNTLLHEMIHVYQVNVLKVNARSMHRWAYAHGSTFTGKMNELNKLGWHIDTRLSEEEARKDVASDEQVNKLKRSNRILMYVANRILCCIDRNNLDYYNTLYRYCPKKFFEILDHSKFVSYPMCRTSVRGMGMNPTAVQALVDSNQIRPIDSLNESLNKDTLDLVIDGQDGIVLKNDGDIIECVIA